MDLQIYANKIHSEPTEDEILASDKSLMGRMFNWIYNKLK